MSTTAVPDRFTTLPDEHALQATVVALEEHGFNVEVVGDLDAAREAVLARIPEGSSVMTNTSVTVSYTHLDVYKRQDQDQPAPVGRCRRVVLRIPGTW